MQFSFSPSSAFLSSLFPWLCLQRYTDGEKKGKVYYVMVKNGVKFDKRPLLHRRYFPKIDW